MADREFHVPGDHKQVTFGKMLRRDQYSVQPVGEPGNMQSNG